VSDKFTIDVFPAQRGDALWIEYGPARNPFRILIDGGITATGRDHLVDHVRGLSEGAHIDLLVVTHIDLDHVQGVIALLDDLQSEIAIGRVWFNGWDQLPRDPGEPFGIKEGIALSKQINARHAASWSRDAVAVGADGTPRRYQLPGGMIATVVSPDREKLLALKNKWEIVVEAFGAQEEEEDIVEERARDAIAGLERMGAEAIDVAALATSKFTEDKTAPNGSAIACLLEYKTKSALLLADAHPSLVLKGLQKISPARPLHTDCVKLSHHGSRNNTSQALVRYLCAPLWILSSNGAMTKHPHLESVARVLNDSPGRKEFVFNYRTQYNAMWDDESLMQQHDYSVRYGDGKTPVTIELLSE
jgi:beta-lactamase superfamily II metal-dependent hydrolase